MIAFLSATLQQQTRQRSGQRFLAVWFPTLPADRIASTGSDAPATFTSRPFVMPAGGLYLNYEYSGALAVELLDAAGRVLPGYARSAGGLTAGSALAEPLRWAGRTGAELAGRTVRVRFHTERARVYALYQ